MISAPIASVDCDSAQRARAGCAVQGKTGPSAKVDLQPMMNIAQPNAALLLLQTVSIFHGIADFLKPVRRNAFAVILYINENQVPLAVYMHTHNSCAARAGNAMMNAVLNQGLQNEPRTYQR